NGSGRLIRALALRDILPAEYIRNRPASCCSVFWGGRHYISPDGETLRLQLALPHWGTRPTSHFEHPLTLATGQPGPRAGPTWERAMAASAIWSVMLRGQRAAFLALRTEPILPPRSSDPEAWGSYFMEL